MKLCIKYNDRQSLMSAISRIVENCVHSTTTHIPSLPSDYLSNIAEAVNLSVNESLSFLLDMSSKKASIELDLSDLIANTVKLIVTEANQQLKELNEQNEEE